MDLDDFRGTEEEAYYLKARDELDNYIKATFIPTDQKGKEIDDRHYQGEEYGAVERENTRPSWDR